MKKYILSLVAGLLAFGGVANDLNPEQMQLRKSVFSSLKAKGYNDANIDQDGDVFFTKDGIRYWVRVSDKWDSPYILTVYSMYPYDDEKGLTKDNVESCLSMVNQYKTVKMACNEDVYLLHADILCKDINVFDQTLESLLKEQEKAQLYIKETISSGFGGLDMTGDKEAIYDIAIELFEKGDYHKAFKLFSYLADADYSLAYVMLGTIYENGYGVAKNEDLMVRNYEKAIESGQTWCAYNLAKYYYDRGKYSKALDYFTLSSASDNPYRSDAYFMVGRMNEEGQGGTPSKSQAIRNYKKSVEYSTELECDARLALLRLEEQVENPADFVDMSRNMLAGLTPEEMYKKGYEYENGMNNRTVHLPKAYGYYKAAADNNNTKALLKMGEIYVSKFYPFGDKSKSDKYYAKAFKALKQQASYSGDANYHLGMMYKDGLGIEKNPELAIECFKIAAAKGVAAANYELGLVYQTELEYVDAFNYFLKAAENAHPAAMLEVAKAYETGRGAAMDREKAMSWYTKCENTDSSYSKEAAEALKKMGHTDDEKE